MHRSLFLRNAVAVLVLSASAPTAAGQTSVQSGVFYDPAVWDTGTVPGIDADVVIQAGHTVGSAPAGARAQTITVGSLTNWGTLVATWPEGATGQSVRVRALAVVNGGTIRAEPSGGTGSGGSVFVSSPQGLLPGFPPVFGQLGGDFSNTVTGVLEAGDTGVPFSGGRVLVDYRNGAVTNDGTLLGGEGARGGSVTVLATDVVNTGLVRGGAGIDSFGGSARLSATTFPPGGNSSVVNQGVVRGGDGGAGRGGSARVAAYALSPFFVSVAENAEGASIVGGSACEAGSPFLFGLDARNFGVMRPGDVLTGPVCEPPGRRTYMDPPDGEIAGAADIEGDLVQLVAGSSLSLHDLGPSAVRALEDLEIVLAPGGVLDLGGLAPGSVDVAGETRVHADTVVLPPGLGLSDLFGGSVVTQSPGGRHAELLLDEGWGVTGRAGETVSVELSLENAGNQMESCAFEVAGPAAWPSFTTPFVENAWLPVGGSWNTTLEFQIPHGVLPDEEHELVVTASTTTAGHPEVSVESTVAVTVEEPGCEAQVFGAASPLFLHVQPGPLVTAPLLTVTGGQPLAPIWLVLSPSAAPEGLELGGVLPTLWVEPAGAVTLPLLLDATGKLQFPVNLAGLPSVTIALQVIQLTDFSGSNGLELTFCL